MYHQKVPATIEYADLPTGKRLLAVSDIHGNLPFLKGMLEKVGFSERDELFIVGDFLEKGPSSLETLRYIMAATEKGNTHALLGNCDWWPRIFGSSVENVRRSTHYMRMKKCGLLWDMVLGLGADPMKTDLIEVAHDMRSTYASEFDFLGSLPHAIETDRFIFVHAGMSAGRPLCVQTVDELTVREAFLNEGSSFDKWVIVGHLPCVLYHNNIVDANPIIERRRKIISIDGGCVLKDDGQLNCLIIPDRDSSDFSYEYYDAFPVRTVADRQEASARSWYIRWGDNEVHVLERGEEFSRCRHIRTGYEMDILTKYLYEKGEYSSCNDCTDYELPLKPGDIVSIVETTSRGYFVKHKGISGWYRGRLKD